MTRACLLCGGRSHRTRFRHGPYAVRECRDCGLVDLDPKPSTEELADLYSDTYFRSPSAQHCGYQDYAGELDNYVRTFRRRLRCIRRFVSPSNAVLEVGMACGAFLKVLQDAGFERIEGIDPSAYAVEQAKALLGNAVRVSQRRLGDLATGPMFDVVFMWDVVEHLPDPLTDLKHVGAMVKPGGRLILETQDVGSVLARVSGSRWHMYKFPEHIYHFNRRTIARLLELAGFDVEWQTKRAAGKYISGEFLFERIGRYARPLRWLAAPFRRALRHVYVNPFDELIVVARKREPAYEVSARRKPPAPIAANTQTGPSGARQ